MINLCELLKDHEGEIFYSPVYGEVYIHEVDANSITFGPTDDKSLRLLLSSNGCHARYPGSGECLIFPSKYQRNWNDWAEKQNIRTWKDVRFCNVVITQAIRAIEGMDATEPIVKSALALLKIHEIIEYGYGGYITREEWEDENVTVYYIAKRKDKYIVLSATSTFCLHIAFHTENQAKKFLSYTENVKLLDQYYA